MARKADNQAAPPRREQLAPLLGQLPAVAQAAADPAVALAGLATARAMAACIERAERDLIQAARDGGATWQQIAAALGIKTRTGAQKRHADLARRWPGPPAQDTTVPRLRRNGSQHQHGQHQHRASQARPPPHARSPRQRSPRPSPSRPRRTPARHHQPANPAPAPSARRTPRSRPGSSATATTTSSRHPATPNPGPGTCWSAASTPGWSALPGAENAAGTAGRRSPTPEQHSRPPGPAGSPPPATPAPATPPPSAC